MARIAILQRHDIEFVAEQVSRMSLHWFTKRRAAASTADAHPAVPGAVPGSVTARLYPTVDHVVSPIETAALGGQRLSGTCTICGPTVKFEPFNENLRESGTCPHCGSSNRQRQMV
jgi:hypothetical protein